MYFRVPRLFDCPPPPTFVSAERARLIETTTLLFFQRLCFFRRDCAGTPPVGRTWQWSQWSCSWLWVPNQRPRWTFVQRKNALCWNISLYHEIEASLELQEVNSPSVFSHRNIELNLSHEKLSVVNNFASFLWQCYEREDKCTRKDEREVLVHYELRIDNRYV